MKHSKPSQEYKILKYLQSGKKLTPQKALRMFGCFRLSARIHRLKSQGHDIQVQQKRIDPRTVVAQYYLESV